MHAFTFLQRLGCGFRGVARLENCKMMSTVRASSWRDLSTNEMSYGSQRKIAAFLDSSHTLNWKDLLSMMPEYGYRNNFNLKKYDDILSPLQMQQLSQQEARGKSPTISLLSHMGSRGRTVGQLYDFCKTLGMNRICELIVQGLQGIGKLVYFNVTLLIICVYVYVNIY